MNGNQFPDPTQKIITTNLTQGSELIAWTEAAFMNKFRTGMPPYGHQLSANMPWKDFGKMTDDELQAICLYLQSLPKLSQYTE